MNPIRYRKLGERPYKDRLVAIVDILGFSSLIERSGTDVQSFRRVTSAMKALNISNTPNESRHRADFISKSLGKAICPSETYRFCFSDTILFSYPPSSEGLRELIWCVCDISQKLITERILLRGAIVAGKISHSNDMAYGPAIIEAHRIENSEAKFPRVILHESTNQFAQRIQEHDIENFNLYIKNDTDGTSEHPPMRPRIV